MNAASLRRWGLLIAACGPMAAAAQTANPQVRPLGAIVSIDSASRRLLLKTDPGVEMTIEFHDATRILRVAPGALDLSRAEPVPLSGLAPDDRILVRGRPGAEPRLFRADTIVVMSQSDLASKQAAERADWEKRGAGGVVTALDPAARTVTLRAGRTESLVLEVPPAATLRRYAADSVRFHDARPCRFEDLKAGDQVKARGDRNADGSRLKVEELVAGSFRDFAATLAGVETESGQLQVVDLASRARLVVRVQPASLLRRLSPAVIQILAARLANPAAGTGGNNRDLQTMIEALPPLPLAELKPGEPLVISAAAGDDPARLTAIAVLAGVESLLRPASRGARPPDIGSWTLDLNMGVGNP